MNSNFSIRESLGFGWQKTKEHSGLVFQAVLTLIALQVAYAVVTTVLMGSPLGVLAIIVIVVAEMVVGVGVTVITLKIARGEEAKYMDIIPPVKVVWNYLVACLLAGIITMIGFILLLVPGVYFALRYSMVRFAVLDLSSGPGAILGSLKKSGEVTHGVKWHLLGFFIVLAALNVLGALVFLIGLLVTLPVTMIAYAHVYQKLNPRV